MHSMPPLVTISSSQLGPRPWSCSWRSRRYSRTLAIPSLGAYCSATAASSRTSRAAISSSSSVGNVAGLGKPPVIGSTPGGLPGEDRGQLVAAAQTRPARERVREVSHPRGRPARWARRGRAPRHARRGWSGRAAPRRAPAPRGSPARRARSARPVSNAAAMRCVAAISRPSSSPNTMSPGDTSTPPHAIVAPGAARDTVVPERGVVPRANTGSPMARRPRRSRQKPSVTMPARPRRFASVANSSPNTARVPPSTRSRARRRAPPRRARS